MFKKRLKGLLAMLLAGSIATTAIPITASATITSISVDSTDYIGNKNQILSNNCTVGPFSSYKGANNLWAYYANSTVSGGITSLKTAAGNQLGSALSELENATVTVGSSTYDDQHQVSLRYSHDVIFFNSVPNQYDPYDSRKKVSITDFSDNAQTNVATIAKNLGFETPLQSVSSWTAYYGYTNGAGDILYRSLNGTSYTISENPKITQEIVSGLYNGTDSMGDFFNNGAVFIVPTMSYKTFEIPVYDGWGENTTKKISVTETNADTALKNTNGTALKGKYVLIHNGTEYNNSGNYITDKNELWSVIATIPNFDVSKAKLVRYVKYDAVMGNFTSVDLLNEVADNSGINYLNERKTSGSIWKLYCSAIGPNGYYIYPNKFVYGDSFDAEIKEFLNEYDCDTVTLSNKTELHITATDPSTQADQNGCIELTKSGDNPQYITIDTDKLYPVKVSDLAAKLTAEISPTAGMKYNKDEWELWPCYTYTGNITMDSKATVADPAADIGITHYELAREKGRNDLLVYFKQVAIAPAVTVTAPAAGASPSSSFNTTDTVGGYSVDSVKWYDGDTELSAGETFARGKSYTVKVTLKADPYLSFTDSTPVTINGYSVTRKTFSADKKQMTVYYDFPETERLSIGSADITVIAPAIGANPVNNANIPTNAYYTVQSVSWSDSNGELTTGAKFEYEKPYTVKVTLTAKDGYKFTDATTAKINGNTATATLNDGKLTVSYTFAAIPLTEITSAAITVTAPDGGASPVRTAAVSDNTKYEVTGVNWFDGNNDLFTDTFVAGVQYKVTVTLKAKDGYKFTDNTNATINGNTADKSLNNGTLTVSRTFTATDGWNTIKNNIDAILNRDNPVIPVPAGNPTIPKEILEKIKEIGKDVVIDYGDYQWTIVADTIDPSQIPDDGINLSIQNKNGEDWATIINQINGNTYRMQISIAYDGPLGFDAYLEIDLSRAMGDLDDNGTYYANLYLVDGNTPVWKTYSQFTKNGDGKWIARLKFTHCSEWIITINDRNMNPALNSGGSTSSGSGSSSEPLPSIDGVSMTWPQVKNYLTNQLAVGDKVTIEMNGITTVPSSVIKVIGERDIKTTFVVDGIRSWVVDGAEIETAAAADLTITQTTTTKPDGLRGIEGTQFSINGTNIPSGIQISFKTEHAGKFANLYRVVDGKLVFVSCGKIAANGKAVMSNVSEKGDYIAMICEYSDLQGDVNNDGIVNPKDSTSSLSHFLEIEKCKNQLVADMNRDNFINPKDSYLILQRYLGIA